MVGDGRGASGTVGDEEEKADEVEDRNRKWVGLGVCGERES